MPYVEQARTVYPSGLLITSLKSSDSIKTSLQLLPRIITLHNSCQAKVRICLFRSEVMILHHVVLVLFVFCSCFVFVFGFCFWFLFLFFVFFCIFQSFVVSHQNEYDCVFCVVFCFEFLRDCWEFGNFVIALIAQC